MRGTPFGLACAFLAVLSCEKREASTIADAAAAPTPSSTDASLAATSPRPPEALDASVAIGDAGATSASLPWATDCDEGALRTAKSIGHTSVVFKVELTNGRKAAWKPNARKVKGRYRGEVAAFRLARALGIDNVPPACFRVFDVATATAALAANDDARRLFESEAIVEQGKVQGVLIPWIDGLAFWPLEKEPLRAEAHGWLTARGTIPPARLDLARQASTLIAFDFLTSNWDRYSGENVGMNKGGTLVIYLDNDAAFMDGPPRDALARSKALLESTDRFSRGFVEQVRHLDEKSIARMIGDGVAGTPLLSPAIIEAVAGRAKELAAIIDAKTKAHGESETLYFP